MLFVGCLQHAQPPPERRLRLTDREAAQKSRDRKALEIHELKANQIAGEQALEEKEARLAYLKARPIRVVRICEILPYSSPPKTAP